MVVVVDVVCDGRSERILGALLLAAACVHAYVISTYGAEIPTIRIWHH